MQVAIVNGDDAARWDQWSLKCLIDETKGTSGHRYQKVRGTKPLVTMHYSDWVTPDTRPVVPPLPESGGP